MLGRVNNFFDKKRKNSGLSFFFSFSLFLKKKKEIQNYFDRLFVKASRNTQRWEIKFKEKRRKKNKMTRPYKKKNNKRKKGSNYKVDCANKEQSL